MRVAALLLLAAGPAAAAECAGLEPVAAEACWEADHRAAEAELTGLYAQAIDAARARDHGGDGGPEAKLREAERAWIAFRDLACAAEAEPFQRAAQGPVLRAACLDRITRARVLDLRAYLEAGA